MSRASLKRFLSALSLARAQALLNASDSRNRCLSASRVCPSDTGNTGHSGDSRDSDTKTLRDSGESGNTGYSRDSCCSRGTHSVLFLSSYVLPMKKVKSGQRELNPLLKFRDVA